MQTSAVAVREDESAASDRTMKDLNFDHIFECGIDTYWNDMFFDEGFNLWVFKEKLGFSEWKDTVTKNTDAVLERTVEVRPPVGDVPAAVRKVLGDNFGYKEHGKFDRKTKRYHVDVETNAAKDKTHVQGDIWLERIDDKRSRRKTVFTIEVKIMLVGRVVEDLIARDMTRSFDQGAAYTNEWIRTKGVA